MWSQRCSLGVCLLMATASSVILCSCASAPQAAVGATEGETTKEVRHETVLFLTDDDLQALADTGAQLLKMDGKSVQADLTTAQRTALKERLKAETERDGAEAAGIIALVAPFIVEFVINFVVDSIKKRASEYTAEYDASASGLVVARTKEGNATRIVGAVMLRRDRFEKSMTGDVVKDVSFKDNELCVIYRIATTPAKKPDADGVFQATPLVVHMAKPRARINAVRPGERRVTTSIKLSLVGSGVDGAGRPYVEELLTDQFAITRLQVGKILSSPSELGRRSTPFPIPMNGSSSVGLRAIFSIKEVSEGYDAKILEAIAKGLEDNKDKIVEVVVGQSK